MLPHWSIVRDGKNYKYVGILYEVDLHDQERYYIVDGQTGKRMSVQQVETMPTTISDMWKEEGLKCVPEDASDVVTPKPSHDTQPDLHAINLDDKDGDWCKCNPTGCKKTTEIIDNQIVELVLWHCPNCGKVNVEYAKMALSVEAKYKAIGGKTVWTGSRDDAVKAAQGTK